MAGVAGLLVHIRFRVFLGTMAGIAVNTEVLMFCMRKDPGLVLGIFLIRMTFEAREA